MHPFYSLLILIPIYAFLNTVNANLYQWDVTVTEPIHSNAMPLIQDSSTVTTVTFVAPEKQYFLRVQLVFKANASVCQVCGYEFSNIGGVPVLVTDQYQTTVYASSFNASWSVGYPLGKYEWYIPFTTHKTGFFDLTITSNQVITHRLAADNLRPRSFSIPIVWFSNLKDNLGTWTLPTAASNSIYANSFGIFISAIPGVSTVKFAILSPFAGYTSSAIIASVDDFVTTFLLGLSFPSTIAADVDTCGTGLATGTPIIKNIISYSNSFLIFTQKGVVSVNATTDGALSWNNALTACIDHISPMSQLPSSNSTMCKPTFAIGSGVDAGRIWVFKDEAQSVFELLDTSQKTLGVALGLSSLTVLDATVSSIHCDIFLVLVSAGSPARSMLIQFDSISMTWSTLFKFPANVPVISETTGNTNFMRMWNTLDSSITNSFNGVDSSVANYQTLELSRMVFDRTVSSSLFLFGSSLVYSPDAGLSASFARSFASPIVINSLTSSNDGSFAFSTSDNQLWYGDINMNRLVPLRRTRSSQITANSWKAYSSYFDFRAELREVIVAVDQSTSRVTALTTATVDRDSPLLMSELTSQKTCPYQKLAFGYVYNPFEVRTQKQEVSNSFHKDHVEIYYTSSLPSSVFLDRGATLAFSLVLSISQSVTDLSSVGMSFALGSPDYVLLTSTKTFDYASWKIIYNVTVKDTEEWDTQSLPGTSFGKTVLHVSPKDGSFDCKDYLSDDGTKLQLSHSIVLYSGCAASQELVYEPDFSDQGCPHPDTTVPCVYFADEFKPVFSLVDYVQNTSFWYPWYYTMKVVGAGTSPSNIVEFNSEEQFAFNPNRSSSVKKLIWTADINNYDIPVFKYSNTSLEWLCASGSPCERVMPSLANTSPHIYLLLEYSTSGVNSKYSYCKLGNRFIIRLYALPVNFTYTIAMTAGTLGVGILIVLIVLARAFAVDDTLWEEKDDDESDQENRTRELKDEPNKERQSFYSKQESIIDEARFTLREASKGQTGLEESSSDDEEFGLLPRVDRLEERKIEADEEDELIGGDNVTKGYASRRQSLLEKRLSKRASSKSFRDL